MFKDKNILAIGAHPDDLEYAVFGTLMKARLTSDIYCYVATMGGENDNTSGKLRIRQSCKALKLLAPCKIFWNTFIGVKEAKYSDFVKAIEDIIQKYKIDLVLTHSKNDSHQDHRLISDISITAMRRCSASLLFYNGLSRDTIIRPNFFVDITDVFELKKQALAYHETQKGKWYMDSHFIEVWNSNGYPYLHTGMRYSEIFETGRIFV